jgi:peptidoglycan DL-endopeptidase CwlS
MRERAEQIALHFLGVPYRWGGDDPSAFDCSGYVIEIIKSVGKLPYTGDWSAHDLWIKFKANRVSEPELGCLVFWADSTGRVYHVEFCLDDRLSIGASGGGSTTLTKQDAYDSNAYVKIRPFTQRKGIIGYADPFS